MKSHLRIITCFICLLISSFVFAQKLPSTQQISLSAPNPKVGKLLAALDNKFQAYNKGNHIYYTIANDDNNLYLVAYTTDKLTIQKIVRWGLALSIDRTKKIGPGSPSVSFPVPDDDKNFSIVRTIRTEVATKASYNKKMANLCKLIGVKNLKGLDGPTISVYNNDGVKALASFNDQLEYTYELSIPLKYLNISAKDKTPFRYDIKLNGGASNNRPGAPAPPMPVRKDGRTNPNVDYLESSTNFGGTCILAAK